MLERGPDPARRSTRPGRRNTPINRRARCRSRPSRRTTPRCAWPPAATSPRSSATRTKKGNFVIGYTREQGHPVCINLDKFVQRSAGVFGATGTGKSFLTRIVLAGLMHHNQRLGAGLRHAQRVRLRRHRLRHRPARHRAEDQVRQPRAGGRAGRRDDHPRHTRRISTWRSPWATSPRPISSC